MSVNARIALLKTAAALLLIIPGLIMVVGLATPLLGLVEAFVDLAHLPFDGGETIEGDAARLLTGILGGVLVGFGAMIWLVAGKVLAEDEALGRTLIAVPLLSWFVSDSAGSVLAGAAFNAVLNAVILAVFLIALYAPSPRARTA